MTQKLLAKYKGMYKNLNVHRPPGIRDNHKYLNSCDVVSFISPDCHEGWEIKTISGKDCFVHPRYTNKFGQPKPHKIGIKNILDKEKDTIQRIMYPLVDPNLDIYELGYSFFNNQPISNKFESFWDTRRGKRYSRYIQYRKYRDMIKEQHHPGSIDKTKQPKENDTEFEKYLIEKNEKKRIMQELIALEEEEKKNNPDYDYDSDDYY